MVEMNIGGESFTVETSLTNAQLAKFNSMIKGLVIVDSMAYLRLDQLHGVLFTKAKADATNLVDNHADIVKNYLVFNSVLFQGAKPPVEKGAIKPIGVYLLLEHLAEINPKKAVQYRASLALLAIVLSRHPQLTLKSMIAGAKQDQSIQAAMDFVKQKHKSCQMSGKAFAATEARHVHHIECAALNPGLAAEPSNLVVMSEWIHIEYHHWLNKKGWIVCRGTLALYALRKGFSTPFTKSLTRD